MDALELQAAITDFVNRPNYQPVKPRVIAHRLGLPKEEAADVRRAVKRLVRQGSLVYSSNHLVRPVATKIASTPEAAGNTPSPSAVPRRTEERQTARPADDDFSNDEASEFLAPRKRRRSEHALPRIVGIFHRTQKGFGFVRPAPGGLEEGRGRGKETAGEAEDIFIPSKYTLDAATGDEVAVVVKPSRHPRDGARPGPRGRVVEIIERQTRQFVGTYFESDGSAFVQIDGKLFAQPIFVGDPGAKNARPDDKVFVEMIRFPSPLHDGEGVIIEVLGPQGQPGVDTLSIIREFNLPEEFAKDALDEARQEAARFDESMADRLDLTGESIVTIDPVDARDFDDAISLEKLPDPAGGNAGGHWRLGVHIADVSHFVRPKTALDREAHNRGTSVYLPDRVLPMLPELISNGLASLQPDKVRYTKSVFIEYTAAGVRTHTEFHSAAIKSSKRLTYEQYDAFLADREREKKTDTNHHPQAGTRGAEGASHESDSPPLPAKVRSLLGRMHELAMLLRRRRIKRGALVLTMPEVKIDLDGKGRVAGAHVVEDTESHQVIEEFMLAANEAVAELLREKGVPFLRRVHESPSPHKMKALTAFVKELGLPVTGLHNRFELQQLLNTVATLPEQHAVNYSALRAMQRAVYSPKDEGHYALASDCYCHFTSPIRRYPDLHIHRLLDDLIRGRKPRMHLGELVVLGQHCSDREQRATAAERDLTNLKLLAYLSDQVGLEMDGLVTGVENFGLFVQGVDLPAEGLIRTESLSDDYYTFDRATHSLTGRRFGNRYRLGDRLRVVVSRVDPLRRELDFRLLSREEQGARQFKARGAGPEKKHKQKGKEPGKNKGKRKKRSSRES
jgi:ribonuclease R